MRRRIVDKARLVSPPLGLAGLRLLGWGEEDWGGGQGSLDQPAQVRGIIFSGILFWCGYTK